MRTKITVTQDDIQLGKPGHADCCPVALAVQRSVKQDTIVHARCTWVTLRASLYGGSKVPDLPRSAVRFIKNFDKRNTVKPFNFFLNISDEYKLGA